MILLHFSIGCNTCLGLRFVAVVAPAAEVKLAQHIAAPIPQDASARAFLRPPLHDHILGGLAARAREPPVRYTTWVS